MTALLRLSKRCSLIMEHFFIFYNYLIDYNFDGVIFDIEQVTLQIFVGAEVCYEYSEVYSEIT